MEVTLVKKKIFFPRVPRELKKILGNNKDRNLKMKNVKCSTFRLDCCVNEESIDSYLVEEPKNCVTFPKLVKKIMAEKNITTKDIYKNSLINRKLFSALNVNDDYIPSRETAIMYCIALQLNYDESVSLLKSAGYTFLEYSNFDRVIKYFLDKKIYNIDKINDALYYYTNKCLGYK